MPVIFPGALRATVVVLVDFISRAISVEELRHGPLQHGAGVVPPRL